MDKESNRDINISKLREIAGVDKGSQWDSSLDRALNAILFNTDGIRYKQRKLKITVDGIWGEKSEKARVSSANNLKEVLGVSTLSPETLKELKEEVMSENVFHDHDSNEEYIRFSADEFPAGDELDSTTIVDEGAPE